MKKLIQGIFLFFILAFLLPSSASAQCKGFAKKICKMELSPYLHDGNYHAAILTEGEEAELYKTFYSDQEYRIAICGSDALPEIQFEVIDANRNVLYSNKDNNYARIWDFRLESSQQLKIAVKVLAVHDNPVEAESGCVAIMFGFREK
ncbi:MAG TPA: hypothetical protein ENF21_09390 [Bacteroidetes bacterium]|nr:hypothetical protein [Bacteroidota bacterium]